MVGRRCWIIDVGINPSRHPLDVVWKQLTAEFAFPWLPVLQLSMKNCCVNVKNRTYMIPMLLPLLSPLSMPDERSDDVKKTSYPYISAAKLLKDFILAVAGKIRQSAKIFSSPIFHLIGIGILLSVCSYIRFSF